MIHYKVSDVELLYASKENFNQNYHYTDKCSLHISHVNIEYKEMVCSGQ